MRRLFEILLILAIVILLTAITQVGGIVFLISLLLSKKWKSQLRFKSCIVFVGLYLFFTFLIIPITAPILGRERIKNINSIKPTNYMTVLLNRNYVRPELNALLLSTSEKLKGSKIKLRYLDANFPFINKFPLLPHLSHNDGRKLDLSLIYENEKGQITDKQKSVSGYGVFAGPSSNELDQIEKCLDRGYFQYDYPKYLTFGKINNELIFSTNGTKVLINALLNSPGLERLFIEPHLKSRLNLTDNRIRYHGCRAVRHDDHIHIQIN